jgi:small acid-soluble spore protein D (minor alpha/beta-type SASP)
MVVTHKSVTKKSEKVTKKSYEKEEIIMASRSSNRAAVPEAKSALDKFKYEVASELGVPLSDGYNGDLTSKQNGSVGGYMVKKMIEQQERQMAGK